MEGGLTVIIFDMFDLLGDTISSLVNKDSIERVILSGFVDNIPSFRHPKITIVYNEKPSYKGHNGRNYKIVSCYNGLKHCYTKYAFTLNSNNDMIDIIDKIDFDSNKLYTSVINTQEPFSPNLDIFGLTKRVKEFWQCPLDTAMSEGFISEKTYITCHYLKLYSTAAGDAILNPERYLYETSPEKTKMIESSNKVMSKYFGVYSASI